MVLPRYRATALALVLALAGCVSDTGAPRGGAAGSGGGQPAQTAQTPPAVQLEPAAAPINQVGTLRFGDLMLLGSELQIVDVDPSDPFDFNQGNFAPQLRAGYSQATASLGQVTRMPDFDDVGETVEPDENLPKTSPPS